MRAFRRWLQHEDVQRRISPRFPPRGGLRESGDGSRRRRPVSTNAGHSHPSTPDSRPGASEVAPEGSHHGGQCGRGASVGRTEACGPSLSRPESRTSVHPVEVAGSELQRTPGLTSPRGSPCALSHEATSKRRSGLVMPSSGASAEHHQCCPDAEERSTRNGSGQRLDTRDREKAWGRVGTSAACIPGSRGAEI